MNFVHHFCLDIGLTIAYLVFLYVFYTTEGDYSKSSFFIYFYSTGISGILMTYAGWFNMLLLSVPTTTSHAYLIHLGLVVYGGLTITHTIGKLLMLLNRYSVLRKIVQSTEIRTIFTTRMIVLLQFIVPIIPHFALFFADLTWKKWEEKYYYYGLVVSAGMVYRPVNGSIYFMYAVLSIILNVLSLIKFHEILNQTNKRSQRTIKQQRSMILYGLSFTIIGILLSFHQFIWTYFYIIEDFDNVYFARTLSNVMDDISTFSLPLLLCYFSPQVRRLLKKRAMSLHESQETVSRIQIKTVVSPI